MTRRGALVLAAALLLAPPAAAQDALAALPEPPAGGLRVYLVRHGQALSNLEPRPALPEAELDHLTKLGRQQAEAVGRALAARGATAVITSPATRARETAELVARRLGAGPPAVEQRLAPMALGKAADGRALAWKQRTAEWERGRDPSPADGESMEAVGHRVSELVRAIARSRRGAQVVLVAHGEVIGAYLGEVRGAPPARRHPHGLENGSISVVDVGPTGGEELRVAGYRAGGR